MSPASSTVPAGCRTRSTQLDALLDARLAGSGGSAGCSHSNDASPHVQRPPRAQRCAPGAAATIGCASGSEDANASTRCSRSSERAPPEWSSSRCETTSRSTRRVPVARSHGTIVRAPASSCGPSVGPVSYTRVRSPTCTTAAMPWPTSSAVTRSSPGPGRSGGTVASGASASAPSARRGTPRCCSRRAGCRAAGRERDEARRGHGDARARHRGERLEHREQSVEQQRSRHHEPRGRPRGDQAERAARERERDDPHADDRDRQRVRDRPDERGRREEPRPQRRERERRGPLRAHRVAQRLARARAACAPAGPGPDDRQHRDERQPEPGGQRRPRIEHDDRRRRETDGCGDRGGAPGREQQDADGEHEAGALCGHAPAGEGGVRERDPDGRRPSRDRRRDPRVQPPARERSGAPREARERPAERTDHRHVEARDRHQVADAGRVEQRPEGRIDRRLVADGECREHARLARAALARRVEQRVADREPEPLDRRAHARHGDLEPVPAPHPSDGTDAVLEPAQLAIERAEVDRRVRPAQPHL